MMVYMLWISVEVRLIPLQVNLHLQRQRLIV